MPNCNLYLITSKFTEPIPMTYPTDLRCSSHEISNFNSTVKLSSKLETTAQNTIFALRISLPNTNKAKVSSRFVHIYYRNP